MPPFHYDPAQHVSKKDIVTQVPSGYKPLTTRQIGKVAPSTVVPVNLQSEMADAEELNKEDDEPPRFGWSAHHTYPPSEVLLRDFSHVHDATRIHPLEAPKPLGSSKHNEFMYSFEVHFRPASLLTLEQPTRLFAHGHAYDFSGFGVSTQHPISMPPVEFVCGGELVTVELVPVQTPRSLLLASESERRALIDLHDVLYAEMLGVDGFLPSVAAPPGHGQEPARHMYFWPRFLRSDLAPPRVQGAQRLPVGGATGGASVDMETRAVVAAAEAEEAAAEAAHVADAAEVLAALTWPVEVHADVPPPAVTAAEDDSGASIGSPLAGLAAALPAEPLAGLADALPAEPLAGLAAALPAGGARARSTSRIPCQSAAGASTAMPPPANPPPPALPPGWKETKAPDGRTYFFRPDSGVSQWVRPQASSAPPSSADADMVDGSEMAEGAGAGAKRQRTSSVDDEEMRGRDGGRPPAQPPPPSAPPSPSAPAPADGKHVTEMEMDVQADESASGSGAGGGGDTAVAPPMLAPSTILAALRADTPNVLSWLAERRRSAGATVSDAAVNAAASGGRDGSAGMPSMGAALGGGNDGLRDAVHLRIDLLPNDVTTEQLEATFGPYRLLKGSLRLLKVSHGPAAITHQVAVMAVADYAAAVDLLGTTHRVGPSLARVSVSLLPAPPTTPHAAASKEPSPKIYVSGLRRHVGASELTAHFEQFGALAAAPTLVAATPLAKRMGAAFVEFTVGANAAAALTSTAKVQLGQAFGPSARVAYARPQVRPADLFATTPPTDAELRASRSAAWGVLDDESEHSWKVEVNERLAGGLVLRHGRDGSRQLWRTDALALEYFAASALPPSEHIASPSTAAAAGWQPLLVHMPYLAEPRDPAAAANDTPPTGGGGVVGADRLSVVSGRVKQHHTGGASGARALAGLSSLLLLVGECSLCPLKSDVTQQALTLPMLAEHMLWWARVPELQRAVGIVVHDRRLFRRAFVHSTHADKPEVSSPAVGRSLARVGTLDAQQRTKLRASLRSRGLRKLLLRMERQPFAKDALMSACIEPHFQRLSFLGDSVVEMITSHHLFIMRGEDDDEGTLTDNRSGITCNKMLAVYATRLGLHGFIVRADRPSSRASPSGRAGSQQQGRTDADAEAMQHDKLMTDLFEGFIGMVYLDSGLTFARQIFSYAIFSRRCELPLRRLWLSCVKEPYEPAEPVTRDEDDTTHRPLIEFERASGHTFHHFGLLCQAFTHPSFYQPRNGYTPPPEKERHNNQRLEFLGDACLQLASAAYLFHAFPEYQEAHFGPLRATLVNNANICDVAATCGMHDCLRFEQDTMDVQGKARRSMLADAFEAFLGALFLDTQPSGMAHVNAFAFTMLLDLTQQTVVERRWLDPKARLQLCISEFNLTSDTQIGKPRFELLEEFGPSHERMYVVGCYLNDVLVAQARSQALLDAQMGAALNAGIELGIEGALEADESKAHAPKGDHAAPEGVAAPEFDAVDATPHGCGGWRP